MARGEPLRVALVVADQSALDAGLAHIEELDAGDRSSITVLCPDALVADVVATVSEAVDGGAAPQPDDASASQPDDGASAPSRADDSAPPSRTDEVTVESVAPFSAVRVATAAGGVDRVAVDAGVPFPVAELRSALPAAAVSVFGPSSTGERLRRPAGAAERATLLALAFGFYLLLGRPTAFDLVTGAATAVVVVLVLGRVTFVEPPAVRRTLPRLGRALLFVPYLLSAIVVANLTLARVLVDPRLPVDPSVEVVETDADSDLERAVLANSLTLTPGTVTVDVGESSLVVHALTASSRASLREGGLRRAVGFVFRGRRGRGADEGRDRDGQSRADDDRDREGREEDHRDRREDHRDRPDDNHDRTENNHDDRTENNHDDHTEDGER